MILLVVDAQEMLVTDALYECDQFVENVKALIHWAREKEVEVVYIRHDDGYELTKGVEGFDIYKEFAPLSNEKIFDKHVNSAFKESGLTEYLQSKQEKMVIIAGLQTDYCIDATVKAGFDRGYDMIIPAFCNTTDQNEFMTAEQSYHYYNAKMWNQRYGKCVTLEEVFRLIP